MSIRTVIDFSPLSETTIPCRTFAALGSARPPACRSAASPFFALAAARSLRRSAACSLASLQPARAARSSGLSCGFASCGRARRSSLRRSFQGRSSSGFDSAAGASSAAAGSQPARQPAPRADLLGRLVLSLRRLFRGWRGVVLARSLRGRVLLRDRTRGLASRPRRSSSVVSSFFCSSSLISSSALSQRRSRARARPSAAARRRVSRRPSRAVFSSSPVACRKRRLNASCLASISFATSSSSLRSCASDAFIRPRPPRA